MKARRRVLDAHDSTPTIRTNLPCHRLGDGVHRALGAVVPDESGARADRRARGGVDDAPPARLTHERHGVLRRPVERLHVDREDAIELVLGDVLHRLAALRHPGVVDHDVEAAVALDRLRDESAGVVVARHVRVDEPGLAARPADGIRHPAAVLLVDVVDDDPGSFGREAPADPLAESRAAPGDDRHFSFETHALLLA